MLPNMIERTGQGFLSAAHFRFSTAWVWLAVLSFCLPGALLTLGQEEVPPAPPYAQVAANLERFVREQMEQKELPAISIALVDDQRIVWAKGFGFADAEKKVPATAATVYRVGSVSKLFTDVAIMQAAEAGVLDVDAPVQKYLQEFRPAGGLGKKITLRQLMSHRAGLVREPPVGHYFDPSEPSLRRTVQSLNRTELVYEPGARTKYSNAGIAVAGRVLEKLWGKPFAPELKERLLKPLGLNSSSFEMEESLQPRSATGWMWTLHGKVFAAPEFELGTAPAGSLHTSALDLGKFMHFLFSPRPPLGTRPMLEKMWIVQFETNQTGGFGLGFIMSKLDGRRLASHGGAIYGFSTEFALLPDEKLGAIVVIAKDFVNRVAERIARHALQSMLAARGGQPLPALEKTAALTWDEANALAGLYQNGTNWFDLTQEQGKLFLFPLGNRFKVELRKLEQGFVVDDPLAFGTTLEVTPRELKIGDRTFARVESLLPPPCPDHFRGLIGEYGWDHDILYIFERAGRLWALIEWFEFNLLEQITPDIYKFPSRGLYHDEKLIFKRNARGEAAQVEAASVVFKRRQVGPRPGENQLRVKPVKPVAALIKQALAETPPLETGQFRAPDLVDLTSLDPAIKLDIRYASKDNFLGSVFYDRAQAFLQRPAAEALERVRRKLAPLGYGLLIHDAYRPWHITKVFWDATPLAQRWLVADPSKGSRHNRGAAVDLTLYDLATGRPVDMVGTYDETTDRSYPAYPGGTGRQRWHRDLLRRMMESEGFTVYPTEWWHFDYKDWRHYAIGNLRFDQIPRP